MELETLENLQARMDGISAYLLESRSRKLAPLRNAAETLGMLPWHNTGVDPRAVRFYAKAAQFGKREWLIVAKRKLAAPRKFRSAYSLVSDTLRLIEQSDLVLTEPFQQMLKANWAIRNPVMDAARAMPTQVVSDGKPIGLLAGANGAQRGRTRVRTSLSSKLLTCQNC